MPDKKPIRASDLIDASDISIDYDDEYDSQAEEPDSKAAAARPPTANKNPPSKISVKVANGQELNA